MKESSDHKVLVVDDEADYCEMLKHYVEHRGYQAVVAHDGDAARELLHRDNYGFVFLDCNMPGLSGVELVKIIRQTSPGARMVMISGYTSINEVFAKRLGIHDFLEKPFSLARVDEILERNDGKKNLSR